MRVTAAPAVLTFAPPTTDGRTCWDRRRWRPPHENRMKDEAQVVLHAQDGSRARPAPTDQSGPGGECNPPPLDQQSTEGGGGVAEGVINHGVIFRPCTPLL